MEQLSALHRRLTVQDTAPFVDFAVFVPFGQKALKASRFRTYVLTATGYVTKDLPGPSNFGQWRVCYRLLRTALLMMDAVGLASLHGYEMQVERLSRLYPSAWHLIYSADEVARSAHANRLRYKVLMDIHQMATTMQGHGTMCMRPWRRTTFWQSQVHSPALTWIAHGSHGMPRTPAEQLASSSMQGGMAAIAPPMENDTSTKGGNPRDRKRRRRNSWRKGGNDGESQESSKGQKGD